MLKEILTRISQLENNVNSLMKIRADGDKNNEIINTTNEMKISNVRGEVNEKTNEIEEALCDIDTAASNRLADLEEALCELSEIMTEGGNDNG